MYNEYKDRSAFLFVYIHEAHPEDGWQLSSNTKEDVVFNQPAEWKDRRNIAQTCCSSLDLSMPVVVDGIDNAVDDLYASWPERIFVVDADGKIAYTARQGPWGFKPRDAERTLKKLLRNH